MRDAEAPPPLPGEPEGPPLFQLADGLLEGPGADLPRLREAVSRYNAAGSGRAELEIEGGRFSVLLDGASREGREGARRALGDFVLEVLDSATRPEAVESTLRLTEVWSGAVRETAFLVAGGELRSAGRLRDVTAEDRSRAPRPATTSAGEAFGVRLGRRKALLVGGLLLVALGIIVVRAGIPDALFKAAPEEIDVEAGPFESLLRARIESIGGGYKVVVARGPAWPADPGALRTLEAAFETNAEIAALRIVASGDALFLRMEDREGEILDEREISLRGLVEDDGARVEAAMPGRRRAARLRLSIASGLPSPR